MTITDDTVDTNAVPTPDNNLNDHKPVGFGRMLRKEDPRFVRGMGQYCDDVQLPGMLHLAILRSPLAHARIVSIEKTAAEAHPKVVAVITGADLAEKNLAWMPTL
ncbi:MAG: carbon monoxide dehydrogenase, partial [Acidimicrobiales bacterium]